MNRLHPLAQGVYNSQAIYQRFLNSSAKNNSRVDPQKLLRAQLIHLGNVGTRSVLTTRNVKAQEDLIQGPRNVMEEKHQEQQNVVNQTLSKITGKLTSLFSKKNFLAEGTHQLQSSTTVSNPTLANQNIYPLTGNIAASTNTNTAISLEAGQTPAQAAVNIINLNAAELTQQLPLAFHQSVETLNKMGEKFAERAINASLL